MSDGAPALWAKGSTFASTLEFIRVRYGSDAVERIVAALPDDARRISQRPSPTAEYPYAALLALWRVAHAALGGLDPEWMERAGAYSIESSGAKLYSGILRKPSPLTFLTQSVSLFQLYYHPGNMEVVEAVDERAVLRLDGFAATDRLFCRRQTGGLARALEMASGESPRVRHVRCVLEGDAFCEWEMMWKAGQRPEVGGQSSEG